MDRRDFFVRGALAGVGALAIPACGTANGHPLPAPAPTGGTATWQDVRALFSLRPDRIHMTGFLFASHPRPVAEAIDAHRRGFDADPATYLEEQMKVREPAVRRAAAAYVGAQPDDVAMTDSTTMGLGLVYGGLLLRDGQEILTTAHDHIVTHLSLDFRAKRSNTPVRKVALYDDPSKASADEIATRLAKAITPATRIIALTWVHSGTGVKLPIKQLAEVVARANQGRTEADRAILFVDGVHGFGNQAERAAELGCDFFVAGCHKWIFGPRGTGLVYARQGAWGVTSPIIPTFDPGWRPESLDKLPPAAWMTPGGFHSYEHRWALEQAFDLHEKIGIKRVADRIAELNTRCKEGLAKLPRVRLITPRSRELSAGINCFAIEGKEPEAIVAELARQSIVASVTPPFYSPTYARLAPSLLTLEEDVDRSVAAVAAIAR